MRTTYHGLKKEIVQALVLIALVILLFLQSMRGTLIVSVAIPLSFAITLIVLYATGQTLNAFTLGGLTLAMGRLVDDAVVVLESIHRHQRMGLEHRGGRAARARNAVALPVLASTLTTMAVLLPVLLLAGLAKKLFAPLALTVGGGDDRLVLREHGGDAGGLPLLPRARRARPARQGASRASSTASPTATRSTLRRVLPFRRDGHRRLAASWSSASGWAADAAAEHVLPRDRRVDGHDLRPLRARHLADGRRRDS